MAIQYVAGRYVVTIRSRSRARPVLMVDAAETPDVARALENEMIAALRAGLPWPAEPPAKGTLGAVLLDAWGPVGGWYQKQVGSMYFARVLDFVAIIGPTRLATSINLALVDRCLEGRHRDEVRAVFQFLKVASDSGAVSWRPVQRKGGQIEFLRERIAKSHKFIRVENSGNGPLWIKVDVTKSKWE